MFTLLTCVNLTSNALKVKHVLTCERFMDIQCVCHVTIFMCELSLRVKIHVPSSVKKNVYLLTHLTIRFDSEQLYRFATPKVSDCHPCDLLRKHNWYCQNNRSRSYTEKTRRLLRFDTQFNTCQFYRVDT